MQDKHKNIIIESFEIKKCKIMEYDKKNKNIKFKYCNERFSIKEKIIQGKVIFLDHKTIKIEKR